MKRETAGPGRPRSPQAREAVLQAVDDLLIEQGYAAMTMKGIAQRAGVGRQTVYRWWATKAEILLEASADDAEEELATEPGVDPVDQVRRYLVALEAFLVRSPAGAAYRALLAAAQHDAAVARLIVDRDPVMTSAVRLLSRLGPDSPGTAEQRAAALVGPLVYWALSGHAAEPFDTAPLARAAVDGAAVAGSGAAGPGAAASGAAAPGR